MQLQPWLRCATLWTSGIAAWLLLPVQAVPTLAQDVITVTVYYVLESDACRPNGYSSRPAQIKGRVCEPLNYDPDVVNWKGNRGVPRQSFVVQPGEFQEFQLQDPLRGLIHRYTNSFAALSEADHRAGVFVFDFGNSVEAAVSLTRARTNQETLWERPLDGDRHWIVHQEAHWLHWFNQITWKLTMDDQTWSFGMR